MRLGPLHLRSRVVFPAHLTGFAVDGLPTAQHAAYYAARAAGGAGLVITEEHSVHPDDRAHEKVVRGHDPAVLPGHRALTDAVHAHGVPVLAQLNHNGGQSSGTYSRRPVVAPSPLPDPMFREVPVELTVAGIAELVAAYADVAARCVAGGFDGVELQCSQASLLRQFLSPATNHRTDRYGGVLANRVRMVVEVVRAVREAVGPDRVVGVRLAGDEGLADGTTLADAVATARVLERAGIDHVNTTVGVATATLHLVEPPMGVPAGYALPVAAAIRRAVRVPVIGVGRFTTPEQVRRALDAGHCDLVGVARGLITDPGFARGPTRRCVGCNQECVGRVGLNRPLRCLAAPRTGREAVPLPQPAVRGRTVLVVGAGPAGLSAAATAAGRGHRVVLCERDPDVGGQLALAATAPHRGELAAVVADLRAACRDVDVRTGTEVDAALVRRLDPDAVVLATGAAPGRPAWAGGPRVVDVRDVLAGRTDPSGTVLVVDELGYHPATSVAELLARRGCAVEVVTPALVVAQDLGPTLERASWRRRAHAAGVRTAVERVVLSAAGAPVTVALLHHLTGRVEERTVDWVVAAVPPAPEDALRAPLRAVLGARPLHRVGDCLAPRRAAAAIADGHRVAVAL